MNTRWMDAEDLLTLIAEHTGRDARVRDAGLLVAAAARPSAVVVGTVVYPSPVEQAAALLHSIASWRPLNTSNAGLAWAAALVHLGWRGLDLDMPVSAQVNLVEQLVAGEVTSVAEVAAQLDPHLRSKQG